MRIIPKLGKPQSRGQEPEPVPENGGERGVNRISGRNTPRTRLAQQMADARAEGVQSRAQAGGAKGAKRGGGGVSTPQRQPAAVRRQRAGQQRANERSGMSLYQRVASALRGGGQSWLSGYDVLVAHERAALTTANNVGGGLVGDYRMPGAGFDYDMGALELMNMLNVVAVPAGEMLVYSGDTAPATIWAAEGAALADATTPTIGRVEAGALSVSSVFEFTSSLAKAGGPEAEAEFMRWVDALLYEAWISAALVGDGTMNRPTGILRNAGIHTIDYGAALTQAHIRSVRDRLRTQKGTGMDPLWILSEAWAAAAIAGGWASETTPHSGVLLQDNAGNGLPYIIVQGLTSVVADRNDPAILGYASEFILPTWGMVVTRFPDPATLQMQFRLELICNAVASKASSFVVSHT